MDLESQALIDMGINDEKEAFSLSKSKSTNVNVRESI